MSSAQPGGELAEPLLRAVLALCLRLREAGASASIPEALDAIRALELIDLNDEAQVRAALRATLIKRPELLHILDELLRTGRLSSQEAESAAERAPGHFAGLPAPHIGPQPKRGWVPAYSPHEVLNRKSFGQLPVQEEKAMKRALRRLAKALASLPGRRREASRKGVLDFRRTIRSSLGRAGELAVIKRRRKKFSRARLILLCDVSGSMDEYSERLLALMHAACNYAGASVFAFSTRLIPVNPLLQGRSLARAAELVAERVSIWNGGTRIASALRQLLLEHRARLGGLPALLVVSDGLDLGDERELEEALREVKSRVGVLIWLNPLADDASFKPEAGGIKVALRHADVMAGLSSLLIPAQLRPLLRELVPLMARRG